MNEIELHEVLEPILKRPAMWLGRKDIIAFGHLYHGLVYLGGASHGGPMQFRMKGELFHNGFLDWANEKRKRPNSVVLWHNYDFAAQDQLKAEGVDEPSPIQSAALGFDLFVADYEEFRQIPQNMCWWDFYYRIEDLKEEAKQHTDGWCFVYHCKDPECKAEGAWYEGDLHTLFKRVNQPCRLCGSTEMVVALGVGEEYEL